MKKIIVLLSFCVLFFNLQSQGFQCGYEHELEKMNQRFPGYNSWLNQIYQQANEIYQNDLNNKRALKFDTSFYEIEVVFHVLYNNNSQNISDALIRSQLDVLNSRFRGKNSDSSRIRNVFKDLFADVKIQFKFATLDPNGNPTSGITRTQTTRTTFARDRTGAYTTDMKSTSAGGRDAWNVRKYLNVWICNMEFPNYFGLVYGFATPPFNAPNWEQFPSATKDTFDGETGVVLHYKIVGVNNPLAPIQYQHGVTAVHEVGHYLGMRHIWGDGQFNGCSVDDGIEDTPNARSQNGTCNTSINSCVDASNDKPDMIENYMDYSLDGCACMFSKRQAWMMRYVLNTLRTGLPFRKIDSIWIPDNYLFTITPNPSFSNNQLKFTLTNPTNVNYNITIYNNLGKIISDFDMVTNSTQNIEKSLFADGIYYVVVKNEKGEIKEKTKFIVQN